MYEKYQGRKRDTTRLFLRMCLCSALHRLAVIVPSEKKKLIDKISTSTHTDQSVSLLGENITPEEKAVLGSCDWSANEAVVHYDEEVCLFFHYLLSCPSLEDVRIDEMRNSLCQLERRHGLVGVKFRHCE